MTYKIKVKCARHNHEAFLALEKKFRSMLKELSVQEGAESIGVVSVKLDNSYEIEDSVRIVRHEKMIEEKYYNEQKT